MQNKIMTANGANNVAIC